MSTVTAIGKILLVDDEQHITELLKYNLEAERYTVDIEPSAAKARDLDLSDYRLVIADATTQPYTGRMLLRDIKSHPVTESLPVIILSHDDSEDSIIGSFDDGADDFMLKPFSLRELVARIRSIMRRNAPAPSRANTTLNFGTIEMDIVNRQVRDEGKLVALTKTEYAILALLLKNKNRFFNRGEIFDEIWRDPDANANDRIVDTNISRLRKKLGASSGYLVNRTGQGYAIID